MTENRPQTVDEVMHKTSFGSTLADNKKWITVLIVAIFAGSIGFATFKHLKEKALQNELSAIYVFQDQVLNKYFDEKSDQKVSAEELITKTKELQKEVKGNPSFLPVLLTVIKELRAQGKSQEVLDLVSEAELKRFRGSTYAYYFFARARAVVLEETGKLDEAVKTLESLAQSKNQVLPANVYLNIGRLYKKLGNTEKARTNLEYLVSQFPNDDSVKMAKIYLSELK